jgi:hypothetical protein
MLTALLVVGLAHADVIDRVVAVVEEQLITTSDIALETELSRLDASPVPFWQPTHGQVAHRLIDAAVIREIARDLALYKPTDEQIGARVAAMRERFPDRAEWQAFLTGRGLDEEGLRAVMERRMVVESFLLRNITVPLAEHDRFVEAVDALLAPWEEERLRIREVPQ